MNYDPTAPAHMDAWYDSLQRTLAYERDRFKNTTSQIVALDASWAINRCEAYILQIEEYRKRFDNVNEPQLL